MHVQTGEAEKISPTSARDQPSPFKRTRGGAPEPVVGVGREGSRLPSRDPGRAEDNSGLPRRGRDRADDGRV